MYAHTILLVLSIGGMAPSNVKAIIMSLFILMLDLRYYSQVPEILAFIEWASNAAFLYMFYMLNIDVCASNAVFIFFITHSKVSNLCSGASKVQ